MRNLNQAIRVELLKARRSKMPVLTALAFSIAPFAGGFFMIVIKDPELARNLGMISAKAQTVTLVITACMKISLVTPIVFFASAGRGYLPPMGVAIFMLIVAQIIAAVGWDEYFPWSVPVLYSGMAGPQHAQIGAISYALVILTSLAGAAGTFAWWAFVDQKY